MAKTIQEVRGFEKKVDELFALEVQIDELREEAKLLANSLKDVGNGLLSTFGSVNLVGSFANAQVQRRRPSISVSNGNITEAQNLLGDRFSMFFDTVTDGTEELRRDKIPELKKLLVSAKRDPSDFFTLHQEAKANDTFLKEAAREALLGKKAKVIFEKLMSLVNIKGALEGVIALKWGVRK